MPPKPGDPVRHQDYGPGRVRQVLGGVAVVDFFGEEIEVPTSELTATRSLRPKLPIKSMVVEAMSMCYFGSR